MEDDDVGLNTQQKGIFKRDERQHSETCFFNTEQGWSRLEQNESHRGTNTQQRLELVNNLEETQEESTTTANQNSFHEIIDMMGVPTSTSSSPAQSPKGDGVNIGQSSTSFSFEEVEIHDSSNSSSSYDDDQYHEVSQEEREMIMASIAELNKKFYARREEMSTKQRERYNTRKQKIKWWDEDRSVISRVATSVQDDIVSIFTDASKKCTVSTLSKLADESEFFDMLTYYFSCHRQEGSILDEKVDRNSSNIGGGDSARSILVDRSHNHDVEREGSDNNDMVDLSDGIDGIVFSFSDGE